MHSSECCHYVVLSVCVFKIVVNFNICYILWTVGDRDFIFDMQTQLMMHFQMAQMSMHFVATGGIVFHCQYIWRFQYVFFYFGKDKLPTYI